MFQSMTGLEYLKCEIACKHDKTMEKEVWDTRLKHFDSIDFFDKKLYKKASNPIGLRAAVLSYDTAIAGVETGYMISLDACSSGLQILSLLVSCPESFDLCGGKSDECVDSYTTIYDEMHLHGALTRKQVKNAIMTSFYGSTATPEATFAENVDLFYDTITEMAPGAWNLNLGLQELWDEVSGSTYEWVMPDGFHACIETKDREKLPFTFLDEKFDLLVKITSRPDFHKGLGPNLIHSVDGMVVREMLRRCMFNPRTIQRVKDAINGATKGIYGRSAEIVTALWDNYKTTGFLSTRILDHLFKDTIGLVDEIVIMALINTLPKKPFDVVSVHDCFRCHPNYGNDLRRQYNTIMADINDSTMLEAMAKQVAHSKIKTKKVGKIDRDVILEGNYLLA